MHPTKYAMAIMALMLACTGVAAANPGCPDCHLDPPPIKNDCGYNGVHQGAASGNSTEATNDGVCASNAHHKQGPWVKLDLCFETLVNKLAHKLGLHVEFQLYASQDGVDVDSDNTVAGHAVSYDKLPVVGKTDDATWQVASQAHAQVDPVLSHEGVNTRDAPVGGDQLPHTYTDACAHVDVC